ncbi:MAG: hypothetical protein ACQEQI_01775 [Bacillota bacterium]
MRLMINFSLILLIILLLSPLAVANSEQVRRGKIVAVNSRRGIFLLATNEGIKEYQINLRTKLIRNGRQVALTAFSPITKQDFQPAVVKLNNRDQLEEVRVNYHAIPIEIKEVSTHKIKIESLNDQQQFEVDFTENNRPQVLRNGEQIEYSNLESGEQGLVILGFKDRVRKIKIVHYQYQGEVE